ncbi:MAG: sugar phosphate isomerase/epimerase family protein [Verrucomicrobiales bacterium]
MNRRHFVKLSALAASLPAAATHLFAATGKPRFLFSVKSGMIADPAAKSWEDKCKLLKDLGYDGVEMDSQYAVPVRECLAAIEKTGLPIHGVVNGNHWTVRLSDPREATRKEAVKQLEDALRFCKAVGGSTVLLVPGAVRDPQNENAQQVWERSIAGIREVCPLAAELGVRIGIETVWNEFLYDPKGGGDQKPDQMIKYLDEINNAWVGAYLDLSNFLKFANIPQWLRAMGSRLIKVDTKDFKLKEDKFCDIGDGDVNWAETRKALEEINYFGWISSEVPRGDRVRLADNLVRMKKHLLGHA